MVTKTDYKSVMDLMQGFKPEMRSVINAKEIQQISDTLELNSRNQIELQNIRNCAVMLYAQKADAEEDLAQEMFWMDCMSAVTHVIDSKLYGCA